MAFAVSDVLGKPLVGDELGRAVAPWRAAFDAGASVLVVDDDPMARTLMQGALAAIGVPSTAVDGGAQALAVLPTLQPAAMILDLMMPGVDGFQVLHALRRDSRWQQLPVFIWTAMSLSPEDCALLARSAQAILDKAGDTALDTVLDTLVHWAHAHAREGAADASPR